eukprot:CAMPEP_0185797080 /NCGR_PEP_ID=MMETSP1174-20130828/161426_1 /TAXON_ID=35687 /ORGANISM="Dictyocha speculum, Strain CCMP1381" /LENGTH=107 /DNA_ID=CAMNT_0028492495 /DNA_START=423 /DNA_END=746 /DNA_ORIENTATION=+
MHAQNGHSQLPSAAATSSFYRRSPPPEDLDQWDGAREVSSEVSKAHTRITNDRRAETRLRTCRAHLDLGLELTGVDAASAEGDACLLKVGQVGGRLQRSSYEEGREK